jgi:hypothetical protein
MVSWQLTATTIICEKFGREVTITIFNDGHTVCTSAPAVPSQKEQPSCLAQECTQVRAYMEKLLAEEEHG